MDFHKFLGLKAVMICAIAVRRQTYRLSWLGSAPDVECMGEENADAEEGCRGRNDLDHGRALWLEMPGRAAWRNWP
jgi:hypothetical protein